MQPDSPSSPAPQGHLLPVNRLGPWLPHLLLVLATLLVYYPVLSHEFLEWWDDQWMVMNPFCDIHWRATLSDASYDSQY